MKLITINYNVDDVFIYRQYITMCIYLRIYCNDRHTKKYLEALEFHITDKWLDICSITLPLIFAVITQRLFQVNDTTLLEFIKRYFLTFRLLQK